MGYTVVRILQRYPRLTSRLPGGVRPDIRADIVPQPHGGVKIGFWEQ